MQFGGVNRRGQARTDVFVVALLLVGGVSIGSLNASRQFAISQNIRSTILAPFLSIHQALAQRVRVGVRLAELRAERDALAGELLTLRRFAEQGREARRLLGLDQTIEGELVAADLVSGRPRLGEAEIFMLLGSEVANVDPPAGVVTGAGLVGVLRVVGSRGGKGDFWSHPDFRVSVRTEGGRATGIVRAVKRKGSLPMMLLEGAPYQEGIPTGTVLFTTGLSGIYPPNVKVGTVMAVSEVESGWARSYFVRPAVRPEVADIVLVWRRTDLSATF